MEYNSFKNYLYLDPTVLQETLDKSFDVDISCLCNGILTAEDFVIAQKKMYETNAAFSFLMSLTAYAKIELRKCARNHAQEKTAENKRIHEDMTDRMFCIDAAVTKSKEKSKILSRMITAKQEENKEINMSSGC